MNFARLQEMVAVNFKLCLIEMSSNKTRSFITSLGIFMGVTALLTNIAFIRAMDNDLKKNMEQMGGLNIITVTGRQAKSQQETITFSRSPGLTMQDAQQLKASLPYIKAILPQRDLGHSQLRAEGREARCHGKAVSEQHLEVYNYALDAGRPFSGDDFKERARVCIIGTRVMTRLFGNKSSAEVIGKKVGISQQSFVIIGVIFTENQYDWRSREVLIPYPVYEERFAGSTTRLSDVALMLWSPRFLDRAKQELRLRMLSLHRGIEDFEINANEDKIKEMQQAGLGMNILLITIAFISLLMGGISIMNIMFATIGDRIREIGIRKALGAQRADIFIQFIIETILLCSVGALPGLLTGSIIILLPEGIFPFKPVLSVFDYGVAILFTVIVGVISGTFPAIRAANMEPAEALRY